MRKLMLTLLFITTFGSSAMALEPMSSDDLKKTTGQIASTASQLPYLYDSAKTVVYFVADRIDGSKHTNNLTTALGPAGEAQTTTEPVREVFAMFGDANGLKSGVSLGFF